MAIEKDSFFKYNEHRAMSGYRSAILVKEQGKTKYSLLVPSMSVPSVFGSKESFEYDLLNSPTKGKVDGKMTLEDKEVEVLHHRDNVYRFYNLKDKVLDFMVISGDKVGYKFTGTVSYRVNDAEADVIKGTYTITPMSADPNPVFDVRDEIEETLCFASAIPDTVKANTAVDLSVVQSTASTTIACNKLNKDGSKGESVLLTPTDKTKVTIPSGTKGLIVITVSATDYADCFTTIYVEE